MQPQAGGSETTPASNVSKSEVNGITTYCFTKGGPRRRGSARASRADHEARFQTKSGGGGGDSDRIELIQDLEFPIACTSLAYTHDKQYLVGLGTYKPRVRIWELSQLGMKHERFVDYDTIAFAPLSRSYHKFAVLRADRYVDFHNQGGVHASVRLPSYGRSLTYERATCNLYVSTTTSDVQIFNLERGAFSKPHTMTTAPSTAIAASSVNGLVAAGAENGSIELIDPRVTSSVASVSVPQCLPRRYDVSSESEAAGISAAAFSPENRLQLAVGMNAGLAVLFDLRMATPLFVGDHRYDLPIHSVAFHQSGCLISGDARTAKLWDVRHGQGKLFTSVQARHTINSVCTDGESGVLVLGCDEPQMQLFHIPALGCAPEWCSFIDSVTEELEERRAGRAGQQEEVLDDFKFLSRDDVRKLQLESMIGTEYLKAYMHGFLIDLKLYGQLQTETAASRKARAAAESGGSGRAKTAASRLRLGGEASARVNADFFGQLEEKAASGTATAQADADALTHDPRWGAMWQDESFVVDPNSEEYKRRNYDQKFA